MTSQTVWRRTFRGVLSEISDAAQWAASIVSSAGLPDQILYDMQLCLEELMSNIVRHGRAPSCSSSFHEPDGANPLTISIVITVQPDKVAMTVEDNGRPFDVAQAPSKPIDAPLAKLQPGGLGIQLIKSFASRVDYRRTDAGNHVIVEFLR
jgi:serine/threonine-protein kinase RsbW